MKDGWYVWLGLGVFLPFVKTETFDCEHLSIVILVGCCAFVREARWWQHYIACSPESVSKTLLQYAALDIWHT